METVEQTKWRYLEIYNRREFLPGTKRKNERKSVTKRFI